MERPPATIRNSEVPDPRGTGFEIDLPPPVGPEEGLVPQDTPADQTLDAIDALIDRYIDSGDIVEMD